MPQPMLALSMRARLKTMLSMPVQMLALSMRALSMRALSMRTRLKTVQPRAVLSIQGQRWAVWSSPMRPGPPPAPAHR